MLNYEYRKSYRLIFKECLKNDRVHFYDESGIPSYVHRNPLLSWVFWKRLEVALALAGYLYGKKVLDFGCGNGVILKYLKEQRSQITGCDNKYFDLAQRICQEFAIEADIYRDFEAIVDKQFDIIFALDVFEHVDNLEHYLNKIKHLSHPYTKVIISGPTENNLYKAGRQWAGFKGGYHVRNIYGIEQGFTDCGFNKIRVINLFPLFKLFRISAWQKGG